MKFSRPAAPLVLCLVMSLVPLGAHAQRAGGSSDQVKARVEQRLAEKRVKGIRVAADGSSVTLSGSVASAGAKQDLVAEVLKVEGVKRSSAN